MVYIYLHDKFCTSNFNNNCDLCVQTDKSIQFGYNNINLLIKQ